MEPRRLSKALIRVFQMTTTYEVPEICYHRLVLRDEFIPEDVVGVNLGLVEVELCKVIGTTHPEYENIETWIEMLSELKHYRECRSTNYFPKGLDPTVFKNTCCPISYEEYDGSYFISTDGNNRTCIAKVLGFKTVYASVIKLQRKLRIEEL